VADLDALPEVLTVAEVARVLRIGRNQAYALVGSDELPSIRVGRSIRVARSALHAMLSGTDPIGDDGADR
jgi:excisionase family DNA binding protein